MAVRASCYELLCKTLMLDMKALCQARREVVACHQDMPVNLLTMAVSVHLNMLATALFIKHHTEIRLPSRSNLIEPW